MINTKPIGLYVHVPFCRSKCPYCDFYSFRADDTSKDTYVKKVCEMLKAYSTNHIFDTVYLGGGTPSRLRSEQIADILKCTNFTENAEITVECNPSDSCSDEGLDFKKLKESGVNRISLGLQSSNNTERRILGRKAGSAEVTSSINRIKASGIRNISLDLMLGIPEQTIESLNDSLNFCINSGVTHISAYMLKIESGTYFSSHIDKYHFPDDDLTADMYLHLIKKLKDNGYSQYEISNFAREGYESRHNLKYWNCEEYIGIGPAAHSFINGIRTYYPDNINYFLSGGQPVYDGTGGNVMEYIMLGLRLNKGVSVHKMKETYGVSFPDRIMELIRFYAEQGLLTHDGDTICLTEKGFLLSNSIISELTGWI